MNKRKRLGVIYHYDENWIGGTYYVINFIKALNFFNDDEKPEVHIFAKREVDFLDLKKEVNYPYLNLWPLKLKSKFKILINRYWWTSFKKNLFDLKPRSKDIDLLFPCYFVNQFYKYIPVEKKIYWIPDFQEEHFPEFFEEKTITQRKREQLSISMFSKLIVLSSNCAKNDFERLYPKSEAKRLVIHFAVITNSEFRKIDVKDLRKLYSLPEFYFMCPNQLWAHKNHKIVIDAVKKLAMEGEEITLIFTGKETDHRNPSYPLEIKNLVKERNLSNNIFFLGFIPRDHMLQLMANSIAVIQPSLVEGWSTVIEDAKSVSKPIIASNIAVHEEQLEVYPDKLLFDPLSVDELRKCIIHYKTSPKSIANCDYGKEILNYSKSILKLLNEVE